jgi:hypothetical protein
MTENQENQENPEIQKIRIVRRKMRPAGAPAKMPTSKNFVAHGLTIE